MSKDYKQIINIKSPSYNKELDVSGLSKAIEVKSLHNESFEDAWGRIFDMSNNVTDESRLIEVKQAMEEGSINRDSGATTRRFSKVEALRMWRVLADEQAKIKLDEMVRDIPDNYKLITDEEELDDFIDILKSEDEIVFDVETTGVDVWSDHIVGHVITAINADIHAYIPTKHEDSRYQLDNDLVNNKLRVIYEDETIGKIAHNAKFDIHMLDREGIELNNLVWDTQEAMKLLNENERSFALKPLVTKYLNDDSLTYGDLFGQVGFDTISLDEALAYAAKDGDVTMRLRDFQRYHLSKMPEVMKYFEEVEVPLIKVVFEMEREGYIIDLDFSRKYGDELREAADRYGAEVQLELVEALNESRERNYDEDLIMPGDEVIYDHKGKKKILSKVVRLDSEGIVIESIDKEFGKFPTDDGLVLSKVFGDLEMYKKQPLVKVDSINVNSHVQLKEAIEAYIGRPIDNTNAKQTLEPLSKEFPIIRTLLNYRDNNKLLTTYVDALPEMISKKTGKLHSNFNQNGAKTGRFSSNKPNLQNQPPEARSMFIAPKGYYIVSADFSAQEVRIIASESREQVLLDAFESGVDAYASLASEFFDKPYDECYKNPDGSDTEERKRMKVVLLMSMYGASKHGLATALDIDVDEADKFLRDFFIKYSKIDAFIKRTHKYANKYGYVWIGGEQRKRRLPEARGDMKMYDWKRNKTMRQGPNAIIQGEAAIQAKRTMIELSKESKERGWLPFAVIHDEVIVLMPETSVKADFDALDKIMTQTYKLDGVDNVTDIEVQKRWGSSITVDEFLDGVEVPENDL